MSLGERYRNAGNAALLDLLPPAPVGGRVLDCGCGPGDNARLLRLRGWTVDGITISPDERNLAKAHCDRVYLADLERGLPSDLPNDFQVVLMSHVLEHLVDPGPALLAAKRVLIPGGVLAVALPNVLTYANRVKLLLGKFDYTPVGIMDETHVRFYTFTTGRRLLTRYGFDVRLAVADGGFPFWRLRPHLPPRLVAAVNRAAARYWPGLFGFQSLYICSPADQVAPGQ